MQEVTPGGRHLQGAVLLWVVLSAIGIGALLLAGPHFADWGVIPPVAADRAVDIDTVLMLFTLLSWPVFVLVIVFCGYSVFKWGSAERPSWLGRQFRVTPKIQPVWLVISILLVAFLWVYGAVTLVQINAAPAKPLQVDVVGEQWMWNYYYPQYGNVAASELHLPVNRPVEFTITSVDVQHAFWIPAFALKQDAIPGETTHISATPNQVGTFVVRCAELCGPYHSYMETPVIVQSEDDFGSWVKQQVTIPTPSSSSNVQSPLAALLGQAGE